LTLLAGIACVCLATTAGALDPTSSMAQYIHDSWGNDRGFPAEAIHAICQSADGFLWIGTERGLVRFDGFSFVLIQRPIPDLPMSGPVRGLETDAEGGMWIVLDGPHLLRFRKIAKEDYCWRD
jgi:hypothetical protein